MVSGFWSFPWSLVRGVTQACHWLPQDRGNPLPASLGVPPVRIGVPLLGWDRGTSPQIEE